MSFWELLGAVTEGFMEAGTDSEVELTPNSRRLWQDVTLSDGQRTTLQIEPYNAGIDHRGYVRVFSIQFNNGTVGNYKLLPRDLIEDEVLRLSEKFLTEYGLKTINQTIFEEDEDTTIDDLLRYLFKKGEKIVVEDFFETLRISNSAYYEITTGELFITHPIQI